MPTISHALGSFRKLNNTEKIFIDKLNQGAGI